MGEPVNVDYTERLSFVAEWYDHEAQHVKHFYLHYYPYDSSVELYDRDRSRMYLRRAACEGVAAQDMFVGNTVRVYGRQVQLTDYADGRTRKLVSRKYETTLVVLKPTAVRELGAVLGRLQAQGFQPVRMKMCELTRPQAMEFYRERQSDAFLPFVVEHMVSGRVLAAQLVGEDAVDRLRTLLGPADPAVARRDAPDSLRAAYGLELASNGFHAADSPRQALTEAEFFFPARAGPAAPRSLPQLGTGTCCVVKPHAVRAGNLGPMLTALAEAGLTVAALHMFQLSAANADEFLEVYKGVVADFHELVLSFTDGPLVAMQTVAAAGQDAHALLRQLAGPVDPDVARQIRPDTLRARFGRDRYRNAVHCTDLPEDTQLELDYFFKILQT